MINVGFTLSSEEFGPRDLVKFAVRAEEAGFGFALISDQAKETALKQWPTGAIPGPAKSELALPSYFEALAKLVKEDDIAKEIVCGPDPKAHIDEIRKYAAAGFDHVYIHQVGPEQEECIRFYEREVLPNLKRIAA